MTTENLETISKRTRLALPIELEEGPDPIYSRLLVFTLCGLIFALLVWANFAKVRELSVAAGEIVPSAPLYELSHIDGGIVETVFVEEGQSVKRGDPLLKLRPETARGELQKLIAQKVAFQVSAERLDAVIEDRAPNFEQFDSKWRALVAEERILYNQSMAEQQAAQTTLRQQLRIATSERDAASTNIASKEKQVSAAKEQFEIQEALFAEEFTSRLQFLEAQSN
ncbi:MAG: biotin/lipoyl-binding protein [Pseudomonadota bacterium]